MIASKSFSELFDFQKKSKIKAGDGLKNNSGKFPFYTSSNELTKSINEYLYEKPSLILGTGGLASIHYSNEKFAVSTDCLVASPKSEDIVYPKFVFHYLSGNIHLLENGFKGAGLKHISKGYISNLKIPLPIIETQKHIVQILDDAAAIRLKTEQLLKEYDLLTQSIFMDMFGKSSEKTQNWKIVKIEDICLSKKGAMRTGPFGSDLLHSEFVEEGISVLGIDNVVQNRFNWGKRRFITEEKYSKLKRYTVFTGDVLISIMGTVGRTAVVPENIGLAINTKHLAALTIDDLIANSEFISFSLKSNPHILRQIEQRGKGAIMTGLNLTIIKSLELRLPPIKLQNQFAEKIALIEKQKELAKQELKESEDLFNCLLQKAFKGELV
jgi:type I restriction enzyme S subunit